MAEAFENNLENPNNPVISDKEIIKEINASNEKEFLREIKKKGKGFLIDNLSVIEKERIAQHITDRFKDAEGKHKELSDKIDRYDETYRMVRRPIIGDDGSMPNYVTPVTTVAMEVIHANMLNVFFTPKDIGAVLPTEENDVPKVKKLTTFLNWSAKNEMKMFENIDRLFHNSSKTGEAPYIVHWVKEYGTEIKREMVMDPANPTEPLYDPDTKDPIFQEIEEQKLLYNGPRLEVFSRKDYIQPENAMMGKIPDWEMRRVRYSLDEFLRLEMQGRMYKDSHEEIMDWSSEEQSGDKPDYEGDQIPLGKWTQEFIEFYGRMRIELIKDDDEKEADEFEELEDEFIAIVHIPSRTLCQLRKNKFPLKMRPIGIDYFMPDDEGRRAGIGVVEFLESIQKCYDALYNQYVFGTMQSNNPAGFFTPMGNQRNEPMKIRNGFMYPTADPSSINFMKIPPPDASIQLVLEITQQWAQLLFGISDFAAGVESKIDTDAPAKKVEIVVAQGNVRLNTVIKRKNETIKDIFRRWFLLYKDNMPPNKFMRIVGDSADNPWKFDPISLTDFALNSIPDFELTGNILNSNKSFEANKALAIYNVLVQNPFFAPQSRQGLQSLHSLTKWLIDKLDETGLSRFLPSVPGDQVLTPEEENARFLQGDTGVPSEGDDHVQHIRSHSDFINNPNTPDEIKPAIEEHIKEHVKILQQQVTQQLAIEQSGALQNQPQPGAQGGPNAVQQGAGGLPSQQTPGVV